MGRNEMNPTAASAVIQVRLRQRSELVRLPAFAPVAMAEQVAVNACAAGSTLDAAVEDGWSWLMSWLRHPANLVDDRVVVPLDPGRVRRRSHRRARAWSPSASVLPPVVTSPDLP